MIRSRLRVRFAKLILATLAGAALSACRSATVDASIENRSSSPIQLVEVDYPSASFGTGSIAAHGQFHYRFKIQGSRAVKLHYVDSANKSRDFTGPELQEGQQGSLTIIINPDGNVEWKPLLATLR
jgi:hypothetical protein